MNPGEAKQKLAVAYSISMGARELLSEFSDLHNTGKVSLEVLRAAQYEYQCISQLFTLMGRNLRDDDLLAANERRIQKKYDVMNDMLNALLYARLTQAK